MSHVDFGPVLLLPFIFKAYENKSVFLFLISFPANNAQKCTVPFFCPVQVLPPNNHCFFEKRKKGKRRKKKGIRKKEKKKEEKEGKTGKEKD